MKYLIFNLKSKLTYKDIINYQKQIKKVRNKIIIAPSNIYLSYFNKYKYTTCAQDVSLFETGSYTGEVLAHQIKSLKTDYVIIGHYERRKYFNESNEVIINKLKSALKSNLKVIYCLSTVDNIDKQIASIYQNIDKKDISSVIIAYEPANLIGANEKIDSKVINNNIMLIRQYICKYTLNSVDIIYGGSINKENVEEITKLKVEGLLIGEKSTSFDDIFTLVKTFKH